MKTLSKLALAAVLATGVSGVALAPPAVAQKKKDDKKAGLKLSPDVLKAAQVAQPAIAAKDFTTAETSLAQAEAAVKTDDDKYITAALRYDLENQKLYAQQTANPNAPINETILAKPLDALLANPSTPPADKGRYAFRRGALAFNGKQYPVALQYFAQAKQLGYNENNLGLMIVKAKMESGDVAGGTADLDGLVQQMQASGQKAPEDYYRYAIAKSNQRKDNATTMAWLKKYVAAYPSKKTWRDVIVTYGLQQQPLAVLDKGQQIDLFRLMRVNDALADQVDYEQYAQYVYDRGLPYEAQAVIKEGQSKGRLPTTKRSANDLLAMSQTSIKNDGSLATLETKAKAGANGKLAAQTGDAYLGSGNFAKAAELYKLALTKGSVDADEVNIHLGMALAQSGDKAGAAQAFAAVKGAPRADIAGLWTTWLQSGGTAPAA